jgi:sec-independent protein translocase protein TatA
LAVVFLILFGSKRLPDSARSLGRSLRIFKSEVQEMNKDDGKEDKKTDPSSEK